MNYLMTVRYFYAVHTDTDNLHIHFVFSSVKRMDENGTSLEGSSVNLRIKRKVWLINYFQIPLNIKVWHCPPAEVESLEEFLAN